MSANRMPKTTVRKTGQKVFSRMEQDEVPRPSTANTSDGLRAEDDEDDEPPYVPRGLRYLANTLSRQAADLRRQTASLDQLSRELTGGVARIDPSLLARFERSMENLWDIPTNYEGAWPPIVAPGIFGIKITRFGEMPTPDQVLEGFIEFVKSILAFIAREKRHTKGPRLKSMKRIRKMAKKMTARAPKPK